MRILSLKEAGALVGRNTEQLRKLINAGQLACVVQGLMDLRASELLRTIAEQRREIAALKTRVRALEALHTYRAGTAHCLPPQAS
jgi:AmiR/NasT family two-component response regulator